MAMAQFAASNGASSSGGASDATSISSSSATTTSSSSSSSAPAARPGRHEVQAVLSQFDAKINQMGDYPAKDIINALTKLAERVDFAQDIVSFLETKIHRVVPQFKLPIFYLTDSILKNVRGPYPALFGRIIVPLYCNCVKQVSGKDLRRFIHVLNTWEQTRLFAPDALAQMRATANKAQALAEPSLMAQSASFSQQQQSQSQQPPRRSGFSSGPPPGRSNAAQQQQQQDMELRSLLTKLQNDMGIHPTEHMTLEEVRMNNPDYYAQLLEFHAAEKQPPQQQQEPVAAPAPVVLPPGPVLGGPPRGPPPPMAARQPIRDPRRGADPVVAGQHPPPGLVPPPRPVAPVGARPGPPPSGPSAPPVKSANVAHLMQLLKRKQTTAPASPPHNEITNDPPRAPDPAAVMSILQKLKGLTQSDASSTHGGPPPPPQQQQQQQMRVPPPPPQHLQQQFHGRPPPPPQFHQPPPSHPPQPPTLQQQQQYKESGASRMWFSDKIVSHKDRVESNVQKLYAALPLVCRDSGLRFKEQEKLNAHLDFLFQYNRSLKERGKGGISRSWYPDEEQWVTDFASDKAPRESTSSSFFDRKEDEEDQKESWDHARVPVDESVTKCRICGESFAKSWDEEEEDWMYTNAVIGTIHNPAVPDGSEDQETIFHKYCYEAVTANSKHITLEHLIPGTPLGIKPKGQFASVTAGESGEGAGVKRALEEEEDSDSDEDVKRIKTD